LRLGVKEKLGLKTCCYNQRVQGNNRCGISIDVSIIVVIVICVVIYDSVGAIVRDRE
jgi:hypothetical protein